MYTLEVVGSGFLVVVLSIVKYICMYVPTM